MSEIKKCIVSRWGNHGYIVEADLSQIEIVVLAYLSGDTQMIEDIKNGVDFHCKRLAYKLKEDYWHVWRMCHEVEDATYIAGRKVVKAFSFQRSYGAGAKAIADSLGIPVEEARAYIRMEEELYPQVKAVQDGWIEEVENSRDFTEDGVGILKSITGRTYTFEPEDPPEWMKSKAKTVKPTKIKNYPVQGFAGEILRVILGKLFRTLKANERLNHKALLVNTVHDSILLDVHKTAFEETAVLVKNVMESVPKLLEERFGFTFDIPVKCDIEYGPNWLEMKTWKES